MMNDKLTEEQIKQIEMLIFRIPFPVMRTNDGTPACPRCQNKLIYGRQRFCDHCGQMLEWEKEDREKPEKIK